MSHDLQPEPPRWGDLSVRLTSGVIMAALGILGIILGGVWFQMLTVFVTAVMVWELWMMLAPDRPTPGMLLAALVASVVSGLLTVASPWFLIFFLFVPCAGALALEREKATFFGFALGVQLAGWGLVVFRAEHGFAWLLWLVLVVMVTDVFGYFIGRSLGGPKFWPRISPKKTWSGTAAGWIASAIVGILFWAITDAGLWIVLISALVSLASQMGDIAESALKRRMGVKDSSSLIPGHGGLFDRFDGLLGGSLFMLALVYFWDLPGVAF